MNSISEQLIQAVGIMFLGMGLVFVFLTILILCIKLVAMRFAPQPQQQKLPNSIQENFQQHGIDPKIVAVITSAIHQYRVKA
ncbi:OadG family protein [Shewanella eurypsychrophilus]|uniref:Probable oxaloacetate decarboxylase gamma chain n=1 Tax=Shewanella eurypsychrophilus TaxID=2593656 RepID=A0ABX6V8R9_9GAMM|nr:MULTISPECIES: OadG family protein [Shewanella]QFU23833.1 sodium pump decarboxylase subunit gamma [Shewanella sp. YLB-09]QPG59055.1 OadG family protein [Shewanella eurypsychrophilus]